MKSTPFRIFSLLTALALFLGACNMPASGEKPTEISPNAVFTAAAQTVEAQLTQNALVPTATQAVVVQPTATTQPIVQETATATTGAPQPTVAPQATTAPTAVCEAAEFIADVTVPDGTKYNPGDSFTKTWRLKNIGTCAWDTSYVLIFDTGDAMGGPASIPLTSAVAPGQQIDLSVSLKAPASAGTYRGYWRIRSGGGVLLPVTGGYNSKSFYVEIQVTGGATDNGGGKFAVNSINFAVTRDGSCASGKYIVNATITTNQAGQVTYTWIRSDGATGAALNGSVNFDAAGSKTVTFEWTTSATGLWVDLYVDNPNHQQFGRASLNCP